MIEHINARCNQWADWCARRKVGGLGFPRECCYTRLEARGGNGNSSLIDEAAWEIHQAVGDLPPVLQNTVMVFYLGRGTADDKARDCMCAKRTMFDRIQMAHVRIMDWLNAEAAGLPHTKPIAKRTCIARTVSV